MTDDFKPDWTSPPGETIRDILDSRQSTPYALAQRIGLSFDQMKGLLAGSVALTPSIAAALERELGVTASFWLKRERHYREELLRLKHPHAVRYELPNGGGVLLEPVCALCGDPMRSVADLMTITDQRLRPHDWHRGGIKCSVCDRSFCADPCYSVHLSARDRFDSDEAIAAHQQTPLYAQEVEQATQMMLGLLGDKLPKPDKTHKVAGRRWRRRPKKP